VIKLRTVTMALSAKVRQEVLLSGDCAYCGGMPAVVDHIMPLSRGGTDDRANLAPACRACNMEKLDFTPAEYRAYREEEGLGWPPKSAAQVIMDTIREMRERYGSEFVKRAIARALGKAASGA
jgi:hypothetical protein